MKRFSIVLSVVALAAVSTVLAFRSAAGGEGDKKEPPAGGAPSGVPDADAMKRWEDACAVNEKHQWLAKFLGTWDSTSRMWFEGAGGPATESKGAGEFSWLFDGRWLQMRTEGEMMGQAFKQFMVFGYDNFKHKYVGTYLDNMGTMQLSCEGALTQDGKTLIMYGTMDEPMTGENDKPVKYVWRFRDDGSFVFELHDLGIGETNTRVVEVTYTRKK